MQNSQTLTAFFHSAGTDAEIKREESSSSLLKLELGIAGCESVGHENPVRIKQEKAESPFTAEQLQELYYQTLVFNFIVYGFPVPFHLLLPNLKSVFHTYPSFTGLSNQNSDNGSMMDPEPGRCRRTDGRKWRCSKNALPNEKYCERHMHRGRKCSRKHVEPSKTISDPNYETLTSNIRIKPISSSIPCDLDLTVSSSNPSNCVPAIKHGSGKNHDFLSFVQPTIEACKHNVELENGLNNDTLNAATITPTSAFSEEAIGNSSMKNRSNHIEGKDAGFNNVKARKVRIRNNQVCKNNYAGSNAPGFGVSRGSVLQSGSDFDNYIWDPKSTSWMTDLGLFGQLKNVNMSYHELRISLASNHVQDVLPWACLRRSSQKLNHTDGKRWRCSKDVVPGQKYCNMHMHRGAKRIIVDSVPGQSVGNGHMHRGAKMIIVDSELANIARFTPQSGCTSQFIPEGAHNSINLNAKPASPREFTENKSTSSSDATTITDENFSTCNTLAISP